MLSMRSITYISRHSFPKALRVDTLYLRTRRKEGARYKGRECEGEHRYLCKHSKVEVIVRSSIAGSRWRLSVDMLCGKFLATCSTDVYVGRPRATAGSRLASEEPWSVSLTIITNSPLRETPQTW